MSNETKIIQDQIYFLRLLSRLDSELEVSLTGKSTWLKPYRVINNPPRRPISARTILKRELVFEIDNDDWATVRNGTLRIINLIEKWGAKDCYYLSYTGNRSIQVHVFIDVSKIIQDSETTKILETVDKGEVRKSIKEYIMRQVALATDTNVDMNLASKHLIRLEGSINEKSGKFCTYIESIPDKRPENYEVVIPDYLPEKRWNLSFMTDELNAFLQVHFKKTASPKNYGPGKPLENPESLSQILRPAYVKGYRHWIVSSLSGHFKRHQVQFDKAGRIVRELASKDEELSSRLYTVKEIYKADESKRIPGLPKLIEIINEEVKDGKLNQDIANSIILKLKGGA
jgi:hypothetical protein